MHGEENDWYWDQALSGQSHMPIAQCGDEPMFDPASLNNWPGPGQHQHHLNDHFFFIALSWSNDILLSLCLSGYVWILSVKKQ